MNSKLCDHGTHIHGTLGNQRLLSFHCPGCNYSHGYYVPHWNWNNSFESPTFTPSLLCNGHDPAIRCHLYVTNGTIQFLPDCHHSLAGKTVSMDTVITDTPTEPEEET